MTLPPNGDEIADFCRVHLSVELEPWQISFFEHLYSGPGSSGPTGGSSAVSNASTSAPTTPSPYPSTAAPSTGVAVHEPGGTDDPRR